jgi:hypothetical protein
MLQAHRNLGFVAVIVVAEAAATSLPNCADLGPGMRDREAVGRGVTDLICKGFS